MKKIISIIIKMFNKILQLLGIKKKDNKKFNVNLPIPNLDKDKIDIDKFDEEVKKSENTDKIIEDIQKKIPRINIDPIPNLDKDKIDIDKFDEEVKKSENKDELNKKTQKKTKKTNVTTVPEIPTDKVKVKKPRKYTKKKTE